MAEKKEILTTEETLQQAKGRSESKTGQNTEMVDVQERAKGHEVPKEVKSWMEKIEEDPMNMKTVTDDYGQPLMLPATPQNPKIQLPVSRSGFIAGFKKTVGDAGRWLSAFILRLIKMKAGNVKFKEE